MRIEVCHFCSSKVYPGHGIQFVRNDCKIFRFCRKKCHVSFKQRKRPKNVKWTKAFRKSTGRELAVDPTFEMEAKRNVPIKYNRELWKKAVEIIDKVSKIRQKRENKFIEHRLESGMLNELKWAKQIVAKQRHLIELPAAQINRERNEKKKLAEETAMDATEEPFVMEAGPSQTETKKKTEKKKVHLSQKSKLELVMEEKMDLSEDEPVDSEDEIPENMKLDDNDGNSDSEGSINEWNMDREDFFRRKKTVK